MNNIDITPTIAISRCINFDKCRYNGDGDNNEFINTLKDYVTFVPFCPEVEIGMETPRKPIRLVEINNMIHLIQPFTKIDLTDKMLDYTNMLMTRLQNVDGFIMKTRSPSCGIKEVKIYDSDKKGANSRKGKGMVGGRITEMYSHLPIEDDGRLRNFKIREHFLTKLYVMSTLRKIKRTKSLDTLINFHKSNTLLMIAYNQSKLKELNKLMNQVDSIPIDQLLDSYEKMLGLIFRISPRYTSNITVLLRCVDYFKKNINDDEFNFILELINEYKNHKVPFSVPLNVIKGYVIRFNIEYLNNQSFFDPFPKALLDVNDSGKGVK
ncbi:hypothetical protein SH1V18_39880 [Vallitalea longa]|uniref:DUF1722 domain-containing protein n=1 Tax=Vallitalea longa TaxID=2936439 RepID=A0A9W5YFS8_9FIRM|nr:DUF523 and DUF1722 domain-containing protein [Vallitalea longa]GKX31508.1 hypothetical protein SH1V18_39880 [Vallitalea longa]